MWVKHMLQQKNSHHLPLELWKNTLGNLIITAIKFTYMLWTILSTWLRFYVRAQEWFS